MLGLFVTSEYPNLLYLIQLDYERSDSRETHNGLLAFMVLTDSNQHFGIYTLEFESTSRIFIKVFFPHNIMYTFLLHMQWLSILAIEYFIYLYRYTSL